MSNGKDMIIDLIVGLIKNSLYKNKSVLSKNRLDILGEILTSRLIFLVMEQKLSKKCNTRWYLVNLASLKTEVDKLDVDKLVSFPVDLSKLSDVVKNDVVKKAVYDKLVAKKKYIDTTEFLLKTKYQTGKTALENKILNVTDFIKKAKLAELENKIPAISSLATKTALTAVENKIPSVSSLVKKTDYDTTNILLLQSWIL